MPYIKPERRDQLEGGWRAPLPPGDLNYVITRILQDQNPESYQDYNELIGVLECVKLEFYRRAVVAYEDTKIRENGDVY